MKEFILLLTVLQSINNCSVSDDFEEATIEESFNLSGAVIVGEVEKPLNNTSVHQTEIILNNDRYYKGCGPNRVKIQGYSSATRCGIFAPEPGTKVMVFVCRDEEKKRWYLNSFTAFAGQFVADNTTLAELNIVTKKKNFCGRQIRYDECQKRKI